MLARSFREHHPHVPFVVLMADAMPEDMDEEHFELLSIDAVGIGDQLRFRARPQELSYLATPFLLRELLRRGMHRAVFFKQETLICSSARRIFDRLHDASILLAPHLTQPLTGVDAAALERMILRVGAFNVGVLGVANDANALAFLDWWIDRVTFDSALAVERGVHYEQRWLTLVPGMFEGVLVDRDPTTNVGHWQLPHPHLTVTDGVPTVAGRQVVAFRFSGFDADHLDRVTRYGDRLDGQDLGDLSMLFRTYGERLWAEGHGARCSRYAFDTYRDGSPISDAERDAYATLAPAQRDAIGNPFTANERA